MRLRVSLVVVLLLGLGLAACGRKPDWSASERVNAQFILVAMREVSAAARLQGAFTGSRVEQADVDRVLQHLNAAVRAADAVEQTVLKRLNAGLEARWKGQFIAGLRLRIQNLEAGNGDIEAEWLGSRMLDLFAEWVAKNKRNIVIPKA